MACLECGFELVEEGKSCAVCGAETVSGTVPFEQARTVAQADATPPRPRRRGGAFGAGEVFSKRYEVLGAIGRGGMGSVYRVRDMQDEVERALKVLHATVEDESAAVRFRREIEILARVTHPGIVRIFDWGIVEDRMYFIAELIDGQDLRSVLRSRGVLSPPEVCRIGAEIAESLGAAHAMGIIHRDVKPHNVMIRGDGRVTLLDFGVARGAGIDMNTITATGVIVGTPDYMAPEQFQGHRVDARSDLYSLGIVLYELLAGAVPFRGDTPVGLAMQHQSTLPPPLRTQRPNVPAWLERIVLKCLEKDPMNRYVSAHEVAEELKRPRTSGDRRTRTLATGDQVLEDDSEATPWALTLVTPDERKSWTLEMALQFEGRFYKLADVRSAGQRWFYRFAHWPDEEILRRIVDYEQDAAERTASRGLRGKLKDWLG
ncbi:MAG TPA: serine/threonine-protein kinase [Thermoanaerobaculia bacterium]|nr:serine/threonine-protein kinase [Thermoanaerobaculia bacterium]